MEKNVQKVSAAVLVGILVVLSFFVIRPIIIAVVSGALLGFIFLPLYNFIKKGIPNKNVASFVVCLIAIVAILLPLWFLTPILLNQSIQIFTSSQQMDFVTPLKALFPSLFSNEMVSSEVTQVLNSFITRATSGAMNIISEFLINIPTFLLQLTVVLFVFFFVLRDSKELIEYIKSLLPFPKDVEKKLFKSSKEITFSILYGQFVIGVLQGVAVGIGFFIFGISNALFLTILAVIAGILPIIGTTIVWLPVVVYLFITGDTSSAIGLSIFGVFSNVVDNIVRPVIVSKKADIHPGIVLLGMIGGVFFFGIIGFIIGPLVISYLLIVLELYRDKSSPSVFIQSPES
ncbi:MAG: AI-2E family transporter [Nanoarchaeota archaeon]|nr:AI-2E family transporter [Nanoarchaeota archaeon]